MKDLSALATPIKLLILDVDGILTDGALYFTNAGEEIKRFYVQDNLGIKFLIKTKVYVAIITGRKSMNVERHIKSLGIQHLFQNQIKKIEAYDQLKEDLKLSNEQIAMVGDDLLDLPLIKRAGFGITVPNAVDIVKQHADWITDNAGGHGAVREICELIMNVQGTLEPIHAEYLK